MESLLDMESVACRPREPGAHDGGAPVKLEHAVVVTLGRRGEGERVLLGVNMGDLRRQQSSKRLPPSSCCCFGVAPPTAEEEEEARRKPSRKRCWSSAGPPGPSPPVCRGLDEAAPAGGVPRGETATSRAILLCNSGLGSKQKLRASSNSSALCMSKVLQMASTGLRQGMPRPRFSRPFGVIRADGESSEMDLR